MSTPDPAPEHGFKILTRDYRPPIQGGDPVWDGETIPFELPKAKLDTSNDDCGAGWNYTEQLAEAITIAGMWPDGSPACCVHVKASDDRIRRRNKLRCSQLTIVARGEPDEIRAAIAALSSKWFAGEHAEWMSASQWDWYQALGRPDIDEIAVAIDLQAALEARALDGWTLRRYDNVGAARAAIDHLGSITARQAGQISYRMRGWHSLLTVQREWLVSAGRRLLDRLEQRGLVRHQRGQWKRQPTGDTA